MTDTVYKTTIHPRDQDYNRQVIDSLRPDAFKTVPRVKRQVGYETNSGEDVQDNLKRLKLGAGEAQAMDAS